MSQRLTVIGDGAMGTWAAALLAGKHCRVTLWSRGEEQSAALRHDHENRKYLPGFRLPPMTFTSSAGDALSGAQMVICAVPTQFIRAVFAPLAPLIAAEVPLVSLSKGIEIDTLMCPSDILISACGPHPVAVVSGPSVATELARQLPATVVAASPNDELARQVQELFAAHYLRVYHNDDILGVELAAAMKNSIAIAAGILDGMRAGNNAKASLLTRGLVEITRLGLAMGAKAETFAGLAGMGDLVTTCVSPEGSKRSFGEQVGRGATVDQALAASKGVVEGVPTTRAVLKLAARFNVEMPICEMLCAVLFENKKPADGIRELMSREPKRESVF
jgi:glycerol-3-phosphate dehydrogenase (NAD(P)+)